MFIVREGSEVPHSFRSAMLGWSHSYVFFGGMRDIALLKECLILYFPPLYKHVTPPE